MKFINKAVVFVMGLVVIGVATTTINIVTQPKNVKKSVTFELLSVETVTNGTFNSLLNMINNDNADFETVVINGVEVSIGDFSYDVINDTIYIFSTDGNPINIFNDNTYFDDGFGVNVGDVITVTFEVEQNTPVIIKTLLLLTPLILSASLIGYLMVRGNKNE